MSLRQLLCFYALIVVSFSTSTYGELMPIDDDELSDIAGQSIIKITSIDPCANPTACNTTELASRGYTGAPTGSNAGNFGGLAFSRVEIGATIEINANIRSIIAGQYERTVLDGETGNVNGFLGGPEGQLATGTSYSDERTIDGQYTSGVSADAFLENVSLGTVDPVTGALNTVVMQEPYIEFAFTTDASGQPTEFAGFRIGAKNLSGEISSLIHLLSGDIGVNANNVPLPLGATGNIQAEGHDVRASSVFVNNIDSTLLGGILDPLLAGLSKTQALNAYHQLLADNSTNFYIAASNRRIAYPKIGEGAQAIAQRGFWANLQDGVNITNATIPGAPINLQGQSPYLVNCFNGNNGNQAGFNGC